MPRPIQPRPPSAHIETLTRMLRQVDVDRQLSPKRRGTIKRLVVKLLEEFQHEMTKQ